MDPTSQISASSFVLTGDIITLDPGRPRARALRVVDGRIAETGDLDDVLAASPDDSPVIAARGTVVPGFIDSHFYLQRAGIKLADQFPDRDPDADEFQRAMADTALDPDWPDGAPSVAERRDGLRRVQPLLHALGITGIADPWATAEQMSTYQAAHRAGELTMRVTCMPYFEGLRDHLTTPDEVMAAVGGLGVGTGFGDDTLAFGALKVYADGEGRRRQALREEPWPGTDDHGVQAIAMDDLERIAAFCAEHGWALGVHAIGGGAMRLALDAFERVDERTPIADLRFRLIHAYLEPSAETIARAARLGVLVSSQPAIQWKSGRWLVETLGAAAADANPLRGWIDGGVRVALGSDGPYFPFDPLRVMWFTRTRRSRDIAEPLGADQRLSPEEALRGCTIDAAYAAFADRRGALAPGMLADWAEVSVDPLTCEDDALLDASVLRTVVGGRAVFSA
ncbi:MULTISPECIES: amidohydrolase [unclassified Microbacterium]|uniref:amidohydrolase n=1 Tax=unclassified Microbacterium TaxID=2609290 RepID=UPI000C2CCF09|nr:MULTISPECIES: amidohydrolase family protein [unclassified Microbacterium]